MKKEEIISKIEELNLPQNSYVVFGGAPLAAAGIREARDIDMLVSKEIFLELREHGWQELVKNAKDKPLTHDVFEVHDNWNFSPYSPTLEHLLSTATIIDGVSFASLEEVRKWKAARGRAKDLADIALIDKHLKEAAAARNIL